MAHPFYTAAGDWVAAGALQPGDQVQQADGSYGVVEAVELVYQLQPMYNLTVAMAHTFFVGDGQWLVHNVCGSKIADGHAYDKHVIDQGEFPEITSRQEFADLIDDIIQRPDENKGLTGGRHAYKIHMAVLSINPVEAVMHRLITLLLLSLSIFVLIACNPSATEPNAVEMQENTNELPPPPVSQTVDPYPPPPLPTVEPPPDEWPTPIELTPIPSPTLEPLPTLPPTPEVTPIPTLSTGFDVPAPEPFWIYGWRGNTVWRMHSERQEEEVLLDTMAVLGVPLADNVPLPHDEFTVGPAVEVSPGGNQLAVVTAAVEPNATREEQVTFLIAIVDLNSGQHTMLGEGILPKWSPDGQHIALVRDGDLWVARVATGEVNQIVSDPDSRDIATMSWSPNSQQIAFNYRQGYSWAPTIWLVNATDGSEPRELATHSGSLYQLHFAPDGQQLYFAGSDAVPHVDAWNIWSVSLETSEIRQLTNNIFVDSYLISPNGEWLFFGGYHLHEPTAPSNTRDLWLLSISDGSLHRLTFSQDVGVAGWNPNASQVIAVDWASPNELIIISLANLSVSRITVDQDSHFMILMNPQ